MVVGVLHVFKGRLYAIDLNYTTLTSHSEWSFVVAGPGALDGLSKCFESLWRIFTGR